MPLAWQGAQSRIFFNVACRSSERTGPVEFLNTLSKLTIALGAGQMWAASGVGVQNGSSARIAIASGIAVTREEKETMIKTSLPVRTAAHNLLPGRRQRSAIPIMDRVADKVIQKYQQSTCEQLWEKKSAKTPPSAEEQEPSHFLRAIRRCAPHSSIKWRLPSLTRCSNAACSLKAAPAASPILPLVEEP